MYSRSFGANNPQSRYGDIPVQSFEDSFSADAFLKQDAAQRALSESKNRVSPEEASAPGEDETQLPQQGAGKLRPDDLLLIGLLVLFLSDMPKNGDKILPVLLAVLLLS